LRPLVLTLVGVAALLLVAAAPAPPPLKAMRWLAPGVSPAKALSSRPVECLAIPADPLESYRVELGRAAFRTPLLLGGQAARAGIACDTCHRNGRNNPDFDFPGVSGPPGTADVTSSLFSSHRGDGVDNPRPIPDLGGPRAALKVSQSHDGRALEGFIHGLVTQEFDGAEPPPAVLDGLAAYVRAMGPDHCPPGTERPVRVQDAVEDARRAVRAARSALARDDPASAALMIEAARSHLGAINERYAGGRLEPQRRALAAADRGLAEALSAVRAREAPRLDAWLAASEAWAASLRRTEPLSLYAPARLARLPVTDAPRRPN
jgi:hypothetical protein